MTESEQEHGPASEEVADDKEHKLEDLRGRIPILAEEALRNRLRNYALKKCANEMKSFGECSRNKFISVVWECREKQRALNNCVNSYSSEHNLNLLRHAYLRGDLTKKRSFGEWKEELNQQLQLQQQQQHGKQE